jgi:hypothetical protein
MKKSTQNLLMIGGGLALLYYLFTRSRSAGNAETSTEAAQSAASTLSANLAAQFPNSGL